MQFQIEGDQLMITTDDFENIQESPVIFVPMSSEFAKAVIKEEYDYVVNENFDYDKSTTLGRVNFELYCKSVGGVTYDKKPIPTWKELRPEIRAGWEAGANGVRQYIRFGDVL